MAFHINNNGDSPESLRREALEVLGKVNELIESLNKVTIHGRNYQDGMSDEEYLLDREDKVMHLNALSGIHSWATGMGLRTMERYK